MLTATPTCAQVGRQPGYILPLAGDTVRGIVVIGRGQSNAQLCQFEASGQSQTKQYTPGELRGYGTTAGQSYESQAVVVPPAPTAQPVFLEVVTRGALTLYVLPSGNAERFFLAGYRPGKLVELELRTAMIQRRAQQFLAKQRMYQDTLARAFAACPAQAKRSATVEFRLADLEKAVRGYNLCAAPQTVGKRAAKRGSFSFGVVAGLSVFDQLTLGDGSNTGDFNQQYGGKNALRGGLEAVFTPGFKGAPLTVRVTALYEPGRTFTSERNFFPQQSYNKKAVLEFDYTSFAAILRYRLGQHRLRPYFEAGPAINMITRVKQDYLTFTSTTSGSKPYNEKLLGDYNYFTLGGGAGFGVETLMPGGNTLWLGVRAASTAGPAKGTERSGVKSVSLLVGYTLGR
ncbi:PorT family protein [Hymenobacter metallicola]|uniref:PorT family protein n=1 Tax=Hymenobacter metallicola TaxID=2563114 RepID=A0A4Z0PZU4_9BACT|nr:PorT family protein [Hymenobacter metallicola]TGE22955.1 PorT family protein [Hymenobacter metallicola]